jgi:hypothetical protein
MSANSMVNWERTELQGIMSLRRSDVSIRIIIKTNMREKMNFFICFSRVSHGRELTLTDKTGFISRFSHCIEFVYRAENFGILELTLDYETNCRMTRKKPVLSGSRLGLLSNFALHPLIHTSANTESSTKYCGLVSRGEVWIKVCNAHSK